MAVARFWPRRKAGSIQTPLHCYFKENARRTKADLEVVLVQPGASAETVTPEILRLLATTELFLTKTTQA
jgi:hypothetical protein